MTIQAQPNEQSTETTQTQAKDPGELSFSEYEAMRRGGGKSVETSQPAALAAKPAEQKKSEESETSETEDSEVEADEESEVEGDEPEAKEDSEKDKPRKKGGFQRRIDKLNARNTAIQQQLEYWKEQALKGAKLDSKDKPAEKSDAPKGEANQAGKPDPDKFDTHAEYVEALTDWKLEQREKAAREKAEQDRIKTEQETLIKSHTERVKAFTEKTKDFHEVLEQVDDVPVSPTVEHILLSSENGPELMYELAKNRADYERINKLSPVAAAREIGKIEAKIAASKSASSETKKQEPKKLTQAPKPIAPVGGSKGTVEKSIDDPELSFAEYERLRREQMKRRNG